MANTLKLDKNKIATPYDFINIEIRRKLFAIDHLRELDTDAAFSILTGKRMLRGDINLIKAKVNRIFVRYEKNWKGITGLHNSKKGLIGSAHLHLRFYKKYAELLKEMGL